MRRGEDHLAEAIRLAVESVERGGGPFGALIARNGQIIARGQNAVTATHDPTAHAEIVALRGACQRLETFMLAGCVLVSSCEPCPMCLAAAYWARIDAIVFAATRDDAATAGFDDALIYRELSLPLGERALPITTKLVENACAPFAAWAARTDKTRY